MTRRHEVVYRPETRKQFRQLDQQTARRILDHMAGVGELSEPRTRAERLVGDYQGLWRYRVGDYRVVCEIRDDTAQLIIRAIGHRRDIYKILARIL